VVLKPNSFLPMGVVAGFMWIQPNMWRVGGFFACLQVVLHKGIKAGLSEIYGRSR
jgi:hypothetical protein